MNVQDLIDELSEIEDKSARVLVNSEHGSDTFVLGVSNVFLATEGSDEIIDPVYQSDIDGGWVDADEVFSAVRIDAED